MWEDCQGCNQLVYGKDIEPYRICNHCGFHFRLSVDERLEVTADEGTFEEWDGDVAPVDPLSFPGYAGKIEAAQEKTGRAEGMMTGEVKIHDIAVAIGQLAVFDGPKSKLHRTLVVGTVGSNAPNAHDAHDRRLQTLIPFRRLALERPLIPGPTQLEDAHALSTIPVLLV